MVFLLKSSQVNDDGNSMANTGGSITAFGSSALQRALILLSETRPLQFLRRHGEFSYDLLYFDIDIGLFDYGDFNAYYYNH